MNQREPFNGITSVATMTLIFTADGGFLTQIGGDGEAMDVLEELCKYLEENPEEQAASDGVDIPSAPQTPTEQPEPGNTE